MVETRIFKSESFMDYSEFPTGSLSLHCWSTVLSMFENEIIPWICECFDGELYDKYEAKQITVTDANGNSIDLNTTQYTIKIAGGSSVGYCIVLRPCNENKVALSVSSSNNTNVISGLRAGLIKLQDSKSLTTYPSVSGSWPSSLGANGTWVNYSLVKNGQGRDIIITIPVSIIKNEEEKGIALFIGLNPSGFDNHSDIVAAIICRDSQNRAVMNGNPTTSSLGFIHAETGVSYTLNPLLVACNEQDKASVVKGAYLTGSSATLSDFIAISPSFSVPAWVKLKINGDVYQRFIGTVLYFKP